MSIVLPFYFISLTNKFYYWCIEIWTNLCEYLESSTGNVCFFHVDMYIYLSLCFICVSSRIENILHPDIAQYEEAEKFCLQLIGEVRTLHFWSLLIKKT